MSEILLYYPSINIPNENWITKSILYTDQISTILPFSSMRDPRISVTLRELHERGHYTPLFIEEEFSKNKDLKTGLKKFESEYIKIVGSSDFDIFKKSFYSKYKSVPEDSLMYNNKFTGGIRDFLKDNGLLEESGMEGVFVDRFASVFYLCRLAHLVADSKGEAVIPCTDNKDFEEICFKPNIEEGSISSMRIDFDGLFLAPPKGTLLKDVMNFKEKNIRDFWAFREEVSGFMSKASTMRGEELRYYVDSFQNKIKISLYELSKLFVSDLKKPVTMSTGYMIGALAGGYHIESLQILPPLLGPAISISMATIASFYNLLNYPKKGKPFSYLYKTYKEFSN